jgi:hypothetical protein
MRLQGVLPSNVIVSATKSSTNAELRAQMMGVVKTRGLEYGIIVRRLSGLNAIEAVRLYPDGHEEAVRDARIGDVSFKSFREIVAVSKDRTVYSEYSKESGENVAQGFLALLGLSGLAGSANNADLVSYVVPDILFAKLVVDHSAEGNSEKPPIPRP